MFRLKRWISASRNVDFLQELEGFGLDCLFLKGRGVPRQQILGPSKYQYICGQMSLQLLLAVLVPQGLLKRKFAVELPNPILWLM